MHFFEQAYLVWFQPEDAFRVLRRHSVQGVGAIWLAATLPFMLLTAAKSAVWLAVVLWTAWTGAWLLAACLVHALASRRFSRPALRDWLQLSAYAHLPFWVVTPFAALGAGNFLTAILVGFAWVMLLEGKAAARLYNRPLRFSFMLVSLPLLLPTGAVLLAFGAMAGALISLLS